jgi:hypothetical protein
VRPINIRRYTLRDDFDPEATADFGQKAVEIQQPFHGVVAACHVINISDVDIYARQN